MPMYTKATSSNGLTTFTIVCDDGHMEVQTYALIQKDDGSTETEDEMMARVTSHIQTVWNTENHNH